MRFTKPILEIGTETAFEVLALARELERQGKHIIHLEIGEPDFDTPGHIKEAAKRALDEGFTHYNPAPGLPELRVAIAQEVSRTRKVEIKPEEVIVLPGAKPAIWMAIISLVNPGEEVILPNPAFPIYESVTRFINARPVFVNLKEENDFRFDIQELARAITPKTRLILLNSPHNPCGSILTKNDLEAVAELVQKHDLAIFSDEPYNQIIYEMPHQSIISLPGMKERTILLDGFSKSYAMTGWRLGYAVAPVETIDRFTKLAINIYSCVSTFSQWAALAALQGPQEESQKMVAEYRRRRDFIYSALNEIKGVTCRKPGGAFYVFPNFKSFGRSSKEIMKYLLNEAGVACLHGSAFGSAGEGYLRLSYANSMENLKEGIGRIKEALERLNQ